jgi:outer membrane protein assembly factor BamB
MTGSWVAAGANQSHVFIAAEDKLNAIDRRSGTLSWSVAAPHLPAASVIADDTHAYYTAANGQVVSFLLPTTQAQLMRIEANTLESEKIITKPTWAWGLKLITALEHPPVLVNERLIIPQSDGNVVILHRHKAQVADRLPRLGQLGAPVAIAENELYVGSLDCSLSAIEITPEGPMFHWKYTGDGRMTQKPLPTANDVYAVGDRGDLACLDRASGVRRWRKSGISDLLSATQRSVIVMDRNENLCAFERTHGALLGQWKAQGYRLPILNDQTDRVYLANNNGLIVAMRDVTSQHDVAKLHFPIRPAAERAMAEVARQPVEEKGSSNPQMEKKQAAAKTVAGKKDEMKDN